MTALPFHRLLSTTDLQALGEQLLGIEVWVYARDAMPKRLRPGFYVINLDGREGPGSHWVAFIKANEDDVLYMDSYGLPPPQDQLDGFLTNKDVCYHNTRQIQSLESILCGFYCLAFFHWFLKTRTKARRPCDPLQSFAAMFSDDPEANDAVLKKYMRSIGTP